MVLRFKVEKKSKLWQNWSCDTLHNNYEIKGWNWDKVMIMTLKFKIKIKSEIMTLKFEIEIQVNWKSWNWDALQHNYEIKVWNWDKSHNYDIKIQSWDKKSWHITVVPHFKQHVNRLSFHIYLKHEINMNEHENAFYFNHRKMSIHTLFQV